MYAYIIIALQKVTQGAYMYALHLISQLLVQLCLYCIDLELITDIFRTGKFLNNMLHLPSLFL